MVVSHQFFSEVVGYGGSLMYLIVEKNLRTVTPTQLIKF